MWTAKDARRSRPFTTAMLEAVDEGMLDKDTLIQDLLDLVAVLDLFDLPAAIRMADEEEEIEE